VAGAADVDGGALAGASADRLNPKLDREGVRPVGVLVRGGIEMGVAGAAEMVGAGVDAREVGRVEGARGGGGRCGVVERVAGGVNEGRV